MVTSRASRGYGERIAQARAAKGMTQTGLAAALQSSQAIVSAWENERRVPHMLSWHKLASVLGIAQEWLRYGGESADSRAVRVANPFEMSAEGIIEIDPHRLISTQKQKKA